MVNTLILRRCFLSPSSLTSLVLAFHLSSFFFVTFPTFPSSFYSLCLPVAIHQICFSFGLFGYFLDCHLSLHSLAISFSGTVTSHLWTQSCRKLRRTVSTSMTLLVPFINPVTTLIHHQVGMRLSKSRTSSPSTPTTSSTILPMARLSGNFTFRLVFFSHHCQFVLELRRS